jgi:hypothetical protein
MHARLVVPIGVAEPPFRYASSRATTPYRIVMARGSVRIRVHGLRAATPMPP